MFFFSLWWFSKYFSYVISSLKCVYLCVDDQYCISQVFDNNGLQQALKTLVACTVAFLFRFSDVHADANSLVQARLIPVVLCQGTEPLWPVDCAWCGAKIKGTVPAQGRDHGWAKPHRQTSVSTAPTDADKILLILLHSYCLRCLKTLTSFSFQGIRSGH